MHRLSSSSAFYGCPFYLFPGFVVVVGSYEGALVVSLARPIYTASYSYVLIRSKQKHRRQIIHLTKKTNWTSDSDEGAVPSQPTSSDDSLDRASEQIQFRRAHVHCHPRRSPCHRQSQSPWNVLSGLFHTRGSRVGLILTGGLVMSSSSGPQLRGCVRAGAYCNLYGI